MSKTSNKPEGDFELDLKISRLTNKREVAEGLSKCGGCGCGGSKANPNS